MSAALSEVGSASVWARRLGALTDSAAVIVESPSTDMNIFQTANQHEPPSISTSNDRKNRDADGQNQSTNGQDAVPRSPMLLSLWIEWFSSSS